MEPTADFSCSFAVNRGKRPVVPEESGMGTNKKAGNGSSYIGHSFGGLGEMYRERGSWKGIK